MTSILRPLGLFAACALAAAARPAAGEDAPPAARPPEGRDAVLEKLLPELEAKRRQNLNVPREDGRLLNLFVQMTGAKRALEVGTSNGYSAIWIALGLEATGGKLTTIEIDPQRHQEAKENLGKAGLADRVTFLLGDAHKVVRDLEGPFDFIFLDADKEGMKDYFDALFPKLQPGGVLLCHNAIRQKKALQEYLDLVTRHPELDTVILSATMDDGFAVSRRKKK